MKIKNKIFNPNNQQFWGAFRKVSNSEEPSASEKFRLLRLMRKFENLEETYQETFRGILEKYGDEGEEGQAPSISPDSEGFQKANEEIAELDQIEHEIDMEKPEIVVSDNMGITANEMMVLSGVMEFVEPEEKE